MADRLLLLLAVASLSLLAASPAAAGRPCHTFLLSFSATSNPSNPTGGEVPAHRAPLIGAVITVFRVRRLGPHLGHGHGHLHSVPANIQIRRPELPRAAAAADSFQNRAKDILMCVAAILFGVACGALTGASMYLVCSILSGAAAASPHYDDEELYSDEEDDDPKAKGPTKFGYVIIPGVEAHDGGKN